MFSRRDLLKFFGISATSIVVPKIRAKEIENGVERFDFVSFEKWLNATSKSIRENKLRSFVFNINEKELKIKGASDYFIESYLEDAGRGWKKSREEFWANKPKRKETECVSIVFSVERKLIPDNFAKWIKDKHGRSIFVEMAIKNELNNIKGIGKYLIRCDEKENKYINDRFLNNCEYEIIEKERLELKEKILKERQIFHTKADDEPTRLLVEKMIKQQKGLL